MAAEYMASKGVDLDAIWSRFQVTDQQEQLNATRSRTEGVAKILGARLPKKPTSSLWDVSFSNGRIEDVQPHTQSGPNISHLPGVIHAHGGLLTPSFCHAHVHLDKCFLLQDEKYSDLEIVEGHFAEAMKITGEAKQRFEQDDLLRRGSRLIEESVAAGTTAMRAFVEVDEIVGLKCVDAALKLKDEYKDVCHVQICAFAQLALFSGKDGGEQRRQLMCEALAKPGIDALGSTPYVEDDLEKMKQNVTWSICKALEAGKFLDFHLDYNVEAETEPLVWFAIEELKRQEWHQKARRKQICLGHCTRLSLFSKADWELLKKMIEELDVSFVGLPTSDLFMMGRPQGEQHGGGIRVRGTLQIPQMIKDYDLNAAISVNNIGNAFTPYGSCSPLSLAAFAVGVYQAGTKQDSEIIFQAISQHAMRAIGLDTAELDLQPGQEANLLIFSNLNRQRVSTTIFGLVHQGWDTSHYYNHPEGLQVIYRARRIEHN